MQLTTLLNFEKHGLKHLQGPLTHEVTEVLPPERCFDSSLVFVSKQQMIEVALSRGARCFIKTQDLDFQFPESTTVFQIPSVSLGFALILPLFDKKPQRFEHSNTAIVHPSARLGEGVILGPYAVVGANTIIGKECKIGSHAVVENNCIIGAKTILHPHVFVGADTEIGTQCEIHSHTTLGSDGYGYVTNPADGRHHKIPQVGRVILEDNVEIGANTAIDRATLTETRIRAGTKIDNLVHIAHNCEVGENCLITAGFMMAGSSKIGRQFMTGGQSGVADHVTIPDNVTLAGRTGVMSSLDEPGNYGGIPAMKAQQYLRVSRALADLPEIWKWWRKNLKK